MRRLLAVLLALLFVACGDSPTDTGGEGDIVDLVLDADSITFVQSGVDLTTSLYAVTSTGDTIFNPDGVTFDLPDGFTRDGNRLRATREASGMVVASLNPVDSAQMRSVQHLDSLAPWSHRHSCYNLRGTMRRTSDDTLISLDSTRFTATIDSVKYVNRDHWLPVAGYGDGTAYWWWEDGKVDTTHYTDEHLLAVLQSKVDTLVLSQADSLPAPAVQSSPRLYRVPAADSGGHCGSYERSGAWVLEEI